MIKNKYPTIKPSLNLDFANTKSLDPRINFRRSTPGAYYDGKTYAKAEENLLSYSEDFANAYWTSSRAILTGGQDAPDGTSDAFKMQQESGQTNAGTFRLTSSLTLVDHKEYSLSIYAKAGTNRNYLIFFTNLTADRELTFFDLSSGKAVNVNDRHAASIQDVGNDWYRCSITYTPDSAESGYSSAWNVYLTDNDTTRNPVADDGGFIYVWGVQLEQRDTVTAYTPTNGAPVTKYQPQLMFASPDQPRFDHDVLTGESKGLLIEESRTNLITYSQQIEKQATSGSTFNRWVVSDSSSNALLSLNSLIAPDGTLSASKFYADSTNNPPGLYQQVYTTDTTPETLTFSIFAKAAQANRYLQLFSGSGDVDGNPFVNFNLFDGTISRDDSSIGSIEDVGNGWYRCIITFTTVSTSGATINPVVYLIDNVNATRAASMTGDDYSGIYVWGAQLEEGSFPTSYIKTSGASVTRSADNASITGENFSSWYRQDEGAIDIDFKYYDKYQANDTVLSLIGDHGYINIYQFTNNPTLAIRATNNAGAFNAILENPYVTGGINRKISFSYSPEGFDACLNSGDVISSSLETHGHNVLYVGQNSVGTVINGHIKKLSYYPQHLTNEQLQQLTK